MADVNINSGDASNMLTSFGLRIAQRVETLAAAKTLTAKDAPIQILDPGGAGRDVTLPAEANTTDPRLGSDQLVMFIYNAADAAEALTVKDDGASTIGTVGQGACGVFFCDGTSWRCAVIAATA